MRSRRLNSCCICNRKFELFRGEQKLRRIQIYRGKKWTFDSPLLGDGLQVLVGGNGAGKSTFSSLIYFGLGGRVTSFEKDDREPHKEIAVDEKNFVHLTIEIDGTG